MFKTAIDWLQQILSLGLDAKYSNRKPEIYFQLFKLLTSYFDSAYNCIPHKCSRHGFCVFVSLIFTPKV